MFKLKINYRLILFPLSFLYALVTEIRNFLYDFQIFKSYRFYVPVINVGNLSVGGSGKTPQIEYLIHLLEQDYKVAVISRGYKRKTKGFIVANESVNAKIIGDEPYQIFRKFKDNANVIVAVGEDRVEAIRRVYTKFKPDIVLLDDAYQHRAVKAGLNILLTPYQFPFFNDWVLPTGNLRECRWQARRADIVLITKTPNILTKSTKEYYVKKVKTYTNAPVFFSSISYDHRVINEKAEILWKHLSPYSVLLITGIANPEPLYSFLSEKNINFEGLKFGDHHFFSKKDVQRIKRIFSQIKNEKKIILTTEKDYVRLQNFFGDELFYLPIQTKVIENEMFNKIILKYVNNN